MSIHACLCMCVHVGGCVHVFCVYVCGCISMEEGPLDRLKFQSNVVGFFCFVVHMPYLQSVMGES